ncbi:acyl-CoA reductase, partial [Bordetella avium]
MSTRRIEAAYLPGLSAQEVQWHVQTYARDGQTLEVALPVLSAAQMSAQGPRVGAGPAPPRKNHTQSQ